MGTRRSVALGLPVQKKLRSGARFACNAKALAPPPGDAPELNLERTFAVGSSCGGYDCMLGLTRGGAVLGVSLYLTTVNMMRLRRTH